MNYKILLKNLYLTNSIYNNKDEIERFFIDTRNLEKYYNFDKLNRIKFILNYKDSIHKFLYESEEDINIVNSEGKSETFPYYFYLMIKQFMTINILLNI